MTQFILSDNDRHDRFATEVHELKDYFTSKKDGLHTGISTLSFGILSESLKDTYIFLYDNPTLTQQYPEGIVTESLLLIPVEKFASMRKSFSTVSELTKANTNEKYFSLANSSSDWGHALMKPLINNLELKLNTQLPENEVAILTESFEKHQTFKDSSFNKNNETFNPTVIKNIELLENIKNNTNEDLSINYFLENSINHEKEKSLHFKEWLSQKSDLLENLPTFQKAVENYSSTNNNSVNFNELKDTLRNYSYSENSTVKILSDICQVVDNMKKECNGDQKMFIENASSTLFPILQLADDSLFSWSVQYIKDEVFPTTIKLNTTSSIRSDFCKELNNYCHQNTRDIMISIFSDFNLFTRLKLSGDKELLKEITENTIHKPKM